VGEAEECSLYPQNSNEKESERDRSLVRERDYGKSREDVAKMREEEKLRSDEFVTRLSPR